MNFFDLLTRLVVAVEKLAEAQSLISGSVARAANAKAATVAADKPAAKAAEAPAEDDKPKRGPGRPAKGKGSAEDTEEPAVAAKTYTKDDLFNTMKEFVAAHPDDNKAGPNFLKKYGVVKLSEVDAKEYNKIITEAQKIIDKKKAEAESSDDDMFGEAA